MVAAVNVTITMPAGITEETLASAIKAQIPRIIQQIEESYVRRALYQKRLEACRAGHPIPLDDVLDQEDGE
jgi:hypothetical protein